MHIHKKERVAIKCESSEKGKKILENEINMYMYLKKYKINIPNIKHIGNYENYKYIVMELLDKNLKDYFEEMRSHYKITETEYINIIRELFYIVKRFHQRIIIHRDIKPENFIFDNKMNLYIIDLGLSTFYSNREIKSFIGNKLYASYNCHKEEYTYTYKDDLISLTYMLFHLYTNYLPWNESMSHAELYKIKKETKFENYYDCEFDPIIQKLCLIYDTLDSYNFYTNIFKIINDF